MGGGTVWTQILAAVSDEQVESIDGNGDISIIMTSWWLGLPGAWADAPLWPMPGRVKSVADGNSHRWWGGAARWLLKTALTPNCVLYVCQWSGGSAEAPLSPQRWWCCPCLNLNTQRTCSEIHTRSPQDLPETCGTTCLDGNNNDDREAVCVLATSVDWESWLQSSAQSLAPNTG